MRNRNRFRQFNASVTMRIGGEVVNKITARYDYRCAECLGELDYWNNGLACQADKAHRMYIHKRNVSGVLAARQAEIDSMLAEYEIVDNEIKPRKEIINAY